MQHRVISSLDKRSETQRRLVRCAAPEWCRQSIWTNVTFVISHLRSSLPPANDSFRRTSALTSPKATPLYAGLQTLRTTRRSSRTPLPPPQRAVQLRESAREQFSKSASFPYEQHPTLSMFQNGQNGTKGNQAQSASAHHQQTNGPYASYKKNTHRNGAYYNNAFVQPVPVFDPQLPSPIVVVHSVCKNTFKTNGGEMKHRGVSRNALGSFYTS
jgi:hypothetical protein